jgi:hypothetical protein
VERLFRDGEAREEVFISPVLNRRGISVNKFLAKACAGLIFGTLVPMASYGDIVMERYSVSPSQCYTVTTRGRYQATRCAISAPARFFQTGNNTLVVRFKKSCFPKAEIPTLSKFLIWSGEIPKGWDQPIRSSDIVEPNPTGVNIRGVLIHPDGSSVGTNPIRIYDRGGGIMEYQTDLPVWPVALVDKYWPRTEAVDLTRHYAYSETKPVPTSCITAVELYKWMEGVVLF